MRAKISLLRWYALPYNPHTEPAKGTPPPGPTSCGQCPEQTDDLLGPGTQASQGWHVLNSSTLQPPGGLGRSPVAQGFVLLNSQVRLQAQGLVEDHLARFGAQRGTSLETATAERPQPCPEEVPLPVGKGPMSGAPAAVPLSQSSSGLRTPRQVWGPPTALRNGVHLQWCSGQVKNLREAPS